MTWFREILFSFSLILVALSESRVFSYTLERQLFLTLILSLERGKWISVRTLKADKARRDW